MLFALNNAIAKFDKPSRMAGLFVYAERIAGLCSATLLVFLAAATRTRIVPADFVTTNDLLHRLHLAGPSHARLFEFPALTALESFFHVVHGGGGAAVMIRTEGR